MNQLEHYKQQILAGALTHAPFDGWNNATLNRAAEEANIDTGYVLICFPNGAIDAISLHSQQADAALLAHLQTQPQNLPVPVKVKQAILWRLQQNIKHREAIRPATSLLSFPLHHAKGLKLLYNTVDTIWHGIGDTATDYNFYTKRMTLAAVYSATLTFWLDDNSENYIETEAFLNRRLNNVRSFGKTKQQCQQWFGNLFSKQAS